MAFGPAGHLYVASRGTNQVLRYDGSTGAFLGVFAADVPSANLSSPEDLAFGPDGNLYVTSQNPDCCAPSPPGILRYDGTTGAFIDIFASFPGSGGRSFAEGLVFGPDGHLYVSDRFTHSILRYNGATGAFIDDFVPSGSGGLVEPFDLVLAPTATSTSADSVVIQRRPVCCAMMARQERS